MDTTSATTIPEGPKPSPILTKLFEKGDVVLLTIKLSDVTTNKVPEKLFDWVFRQYLKENNLDKEVSTPQELATYMVLKALDETKPATK